MFVDLDRTLLRSASGPVFQQAMVAEGVLPAGPASARRTPHVRLLQPVRRVGALHRAGPGRGPGHAGPVGRRHPPGRQAGGRAAGRPGPALGPGGPGGPPGGGPGRWCWPPPRPLDMVAPLAEALGFDAVIATRYEEERRPLHRPARRPVRLGDREAGRRPASGRADHGTDLAASHAYSDSFFDLPLLPRRGPSPPAQRRSPAGGRGAGPALAARALGPAPGHPLPRGPRALPPGPAVLPARGLPLRPLHINGVEHIPAQGPVLLASNHRSYFDVAAIGLVAARLGRPVRFLAKQEVFDAPVVGRLARALGGHPRRPGPSRRRPAIPCARPAAALRAGEVVIVLPQGTIPRGDAFFDPVLPGQTGTARLAAETGAPVVPIGLWGTEEVWPRSSRVPNMTALQHPPEVTVTRRARR